MSKTVFAVAAHPDDIEFNMAGTLILLKEAGYEVHYMNIANGSCGSLTMDAETIAKIRDKESRTAADSIGAIFHAWLVNDFEIIYSVELHRKMTSIMREVEPEIVLTHSPSDYMEDHINAGRLAVSAAFCRNMPNLPVIPTKDATFQDVTVYHAQPHCNRDPLGNPVKPGLYVDISSVIDKKESMLACHKTQKEWLDKAQGMDSYLKTMRSLSEEVGAFSGKYKYAEGWRKRLYVGFCAPEADPLCAALKKFAGKSA